MMRLFHKAPPYCASCGKGFRTNAHALWDGNMFIHAQCYTTWWTYQALMPDAAHWVEPHDALRPGSIYLQCGKKELAKAKLHDIPSM